MGFSDALWEELAAGLPGNVELARLTVRLLAAVVLGGVLGWQRALMGKAAGTRTHMLVALGAAMVVLLAEQKEMATADMSRIIQGTLTGIGFIGGGVILKMSAQHQILGVTTAASIWLTATLGIVAGAGRLGLAVAGGVLAFAILSILGRLEREFVTNHQGGKGESPDTPRDESEG